MLKEADTLVAGQDELGQMDTECTQIEEELLEWQIQQEIFGGLGVPKLHPREGTAAGGAGEGAAGLRDAHASSQRLVPAAPAAAAYPGEQQGWVVGVVCGYAMAVVHLDAWCLS